MSHRHHLAIIGSGASCIYLLKHLLDHYAVLKDDLGAISIFEKSGITGMGMPYSPSTTDRYNMANISSEELPELTVSFANWLRAQEPAVLKELNLEEVAIKEDKIYSRLALGKYLNAQYKTLIAGLRKGGLEIQEYSGCEIVDVQDRPTEDCIILTPAGGEHLSFDRVIIATGHHWSEQDNPASGYYASPWPIRKLLPEEGHHHAFTIGTLGASLSAFDVICSLAHRHGKFFSTPSGLTYEPHPDTEDFKLIMHSSHGLLPHLQFDQEETFRAIYRHVDRNAMLNLVDGQGFLRLDTYFDQICRPALSEAFAKDQMPHMVDCMADPEFGLKDFVDKMTDKHDYANAFEGMRHEMKEARHSVLQHQPIHWKEVIDDLMYTLNYHAELLPAEDHLVLKSKVMPFLLNVVAAMPLPSGEILLALYDAGKLDIVTGRVSLDEDQSEPGGTTVQVKEEENVIKLNYRMFIDCSGQKPLELEDYPFPSLVRDGTARKARVPFSNPAKAIASLSEAEQEHLFQDAGQTFYHIGGVDIDGTYRLIGTDGEANPRIRDIAFPHTSGIRPYSYGLQACSDTGAILVEAWTQEIKAHEPVENDPQQFTKIYEKI